MNVQRYNTSPDIRSFEEIADDARAVGLMVSCVEDVKDFDYRSNEWINYGVRFDERRFADRFLMSQTTAGYLNIDLRESEITRQNLYDAFLKSRPLIRDAVNAVKEVVKTENFYHNRSSKEELMVKVASSLEDHSSLEKAAILSAINPVQPFSDKGGSYIYGFDSTGKYLTPSSDAIYSDLTEGKFIDFNEETIDPDEKIQITIPCYMFSGLCTTPSSQLYGQVYCEMDADGNVTLGHPVHDALLQEQDDPETEADFDPADE